MMDVRFERSTARWELSRAPIADWQHAEQIADDLIVFRDAGGAIVALLIDAVDEAAVRPEVVALVRDLVGADTADQLLGGADHAAIVAATPPGAIGPIGDGVDLGFVIDPASAPPVVDTSRPGRVSWEAATSSVVMEVPVTGSPPDGLWASLVDERSGDVLAAGRLIPITEHATATRMTLGVPVEGRSVRVRITRGSGPDGGGAVGTRPPNPLLYGAIGLIVVLVVATIAVALSIGTPMSLDAVSLASLFEGTAMVVEMVVAAFLVERLWHFPMLRPWIGFVVVATVFAYSNLMYAMINIASAWGTGYSALAEDIQHISLLGLPLAAGWALFRLVRGKDA